eukprot:2580119-Lingulodinium_polyedra.AAC.1
MACSACFPAFLPLSSPLSVGGAPRALADASTQTDAAAVGEESAAIEPRLGQLQAHINVIMSFPR